ncbi:MULTISPECIES: flavin reductase family protein [Bradyrhizobium]|uniref:Flavin reductase n=3 Tax=Bradyrhizobium TaxID=374 RepID=A0A410VIY3_9BRAD|nr:MULTISPECIES: flavin reductase family protein [Bradyrhizobium]MCG2629487.1 flavin reductase family protein [Bradyrhizobium zhengyangense]MCG2644885.1 flavin reductase family protein [Bradyrhizobium zhengyangense]MCG2671001.1 flavin reductase family protein [Bradyrhizobium zhengyangense]MDN4984636.1 flavin reductase family protein [Bradyrhizobium sp. WYCCWR 13022]MDN5002628.1 flavin reductase family protein [Bradyrhizobium sp. WYCCWR 12677]
MIDAGRAIATATPETFREVSRKWASGIAVVTAVDSHGALFGTTMSAVVSLSISPLQYLICIDRKSNSLPAITSTGWFCINMLSSSQERIAMTFAKKGTDKFSAISYREGLNRLPIIQDVASYIICHLNSSFDGGDHVIIVGDVIEIGLHDASPLVYLNGRFNNG